MLSAKEIETITKSLSRTPFIVTSTFHKVLANALCTTSRIKTHDTLTCFACGKGRDDLYHYIKCPRISFIFGLPPAFGSLHASYFTPSTLAKLSVFFETYYIVSRQYGHSFGKSSFEFIANKTFNIARHVAIKNRVLHLSHSSCISYAQVQEYIQSHMSPAHAYNNSVYDAAFIFAH